MSEGQPVTPPLHDLEKEGVLEGLITQGRTPGGFVRALCSPVMDPDKLYSDLVYGRTSKRQAKEVVFCFVPPDGMQPDDKATGTPTWGYEVLAPDGASKGSCKMYEMTPDQAERIVKRIRHLQEEKAS